MLFNSTSYLIFLLLVVTIYHQLTPTGRRWTLLAASYIFYAFWCLPFLAALGGSNPIGYRWGMIFLALLGCSTVVNYCYGRLIGLAPHERDAVQPHGAPPPPQGHPFPADADRIPRRKFWMIMAVVTNVGILCIFKYKGFFSDVVFQVSHHHPWSPLNWVLPLGISFYTFESISYTVDVYHGVTKPIRSLLDMALYVSFFPHLIAGPIIRAGDLVPQLTADQPFAWENIRVGIARFVWGMVKKIYVADVMAKVVTEIYGSPGSYSGVGLVMGTYAFAAQIYCDFSAYTDMAIGSAIMLGIKLPENFNMPYLSCGIREFWRRWHISLSTWLRDYLYIPLGGSRRGIFRTYVNLFITMLLGGLWHGAAWSFIVWGGVHGGMMCFERRFDISEKPPASLPWKLIRWFITLQIVCASWVLFRAKNLTTAMWIFKRIFISATGTMPVDYRPAVYLLAVIVAELLGTQKRWIRLMNNKPIFARWAAYAAATAFILTFSRASNPEFIYFQF